MPRFIDIDGGAPIAAAADARQAIGVGKVVSVSNYVSTTASYEAAIAAAITAAGVNGVVDFEGVSYVTTDTVTVSTNGVTLQNGGIRPTGTFPALIVTADDVAVRRMVFSRSQSWGGDTDPKYCVGINGERFRSYDCLYLQSHGPCLYLTHGTCDGAVISGGEMTGASARQNASGVYVAAGNDGNSAITVSDVHIHDLTDGILLFDTANSTLIGNRIDALRKLPTIELTDWENVSGNVWRQRSAAGTPGVGTASADDREDGPTRAITVNGTKWGAVAVESTSPSTNSASISGGYVYINMNGTDPNTATILSDIVSGYALMVYASTVENNALCSGNRILNNTVDDCDGFGVYLQVGGDDATKDTQISGNILTNVCLEGSQMSALPFSGIGITGGSDTVLVNNSIRGVGADGKAVPGVRIDWPVANTGTPGGRIVGTTVTGSYSSGFLLSASNWGVHGCVANGNVDGFRVYNNGTGATVSNVGLVECRADNNSGEGFSVGGTETTVSYQSIRILGGGANNNGRRGVLLKSASSTPTVFDSAVIGASLKENLATSSRIQIEIDGQCARTTISGCFLAHTSGSTAYGIWMSASATGTVIDNNQYSITTPENLNSTPVRIGGAQTQWRGTGSPEGVVTAPVGSVYHRTDGTADTALYVKQTGTSNTGWATPARTTDVQVFTTSGTWTKPAGAVTVRVLCIGPGGGGGAGARGPSGTALSGGGGGGGGGFSVMEFPASDLTSTVAVTTSTGGIGASGQTSNDSAGSNGSAAAYSTVFGTYVSALNGAGGGGGGLAVAGAAGLGFASGWGVGMLGGSVGGAGSASGAAGAQPTNAYGPGGGGGGGGINTGGTASAGAAGSRTYSAWSWGTGGTAGNAANGGVGGSAVKAPGGGGGGGGANASGAGYNGGNGGNYGAGGGGGGAALNGSTSGAGGNGGDGICVVTTYF